MVRLQFNKLGEMCQYSLNPTVGQADSKTIWRAVSYNAKMFCCVTSVLQKAEWHYIILFHLQCVSLGLEYWKAGQQSKCPQGHLQQPKYIRFNCKYHQKCLYIMNRRPSSLLYFRYRRPYCRWHTQERCTMRVCTLMFWRSFKYVHKWHLVLAVTKATKC